MRRPGAGVIAILGLGIVVALVVTAVTGGFTAPPRWEYSEIADNLLRGEGHVYIYRGTPYHFYGPPLYPMFLAAALWSSGGRESAVLVVQAILFGVTGAIVLVTARRVAPGLAALLAGLLVVLHPGNAVYAGQLHSQVVDVLLIVMTFALFLRLGPEARLLRAALCGTVAGLAVLSRGTVLPFLVVWAVWFLWKHRRRFPRALGTVTAVTVGTVVVLSPLVVRGYVLYGRVLPLRTDTGLNLWYGNHRGASGTSHTLTASPEPVVAQLPPALASTLAGATELEQNRLLTRAALDFWAAEPVSAMALFGRKLYYFWWFSPHAGLLYPEAWTRLYAAYYAVVLVLAIIGLLAVARGLSREAVELFLLLVAAVSVTQAVFYVEGRHRWQVEPLLLIFTAVGLLTSMSALGLAGRHMWHRARAQKLRGSA